MSANSDCKYNIVCLSNQLWDFPNWTNKRHVMSRLAALGHKVFFIDPPINMGRLFLRQVMLGKWPPKRLLSLCYQSGEVVVCTPLNFLPFFEWLSRIHARTIQKLANKVLDPQRKTVLWVYHVEIAGLENYLKYIKADLVVYDCVDNYTGFPRYNTPAKKQKINNQEKLLATRADVVFATTPGLAERLKKYNPNVFYTPNVGDYERFKDVRKITRLPADLVNIPRPRIGFTGSVDEYKFDKALFRKVAEENPKYSFVVIGPIALKDRNASAAELGWSDLKNVYYLGSKDFEIVREYFAGFDAFIIPYQLNDYTVGGCFPIKFHDALAAGFPVVVTDLPAYKPFADVCYISKTYDEFSASIPKALSEDNDLRIKARQEVAKQNSWEIKVQNVMNIVSEFLALK